MVEIGVAVTEEPDVELKPEAGLHANVRAPVATRLVDEPAHIARSGLTVNEGFGFTVIGNEANPVVRKQPVLSVIFVNETV